MAGDVLQVLLLQGAGRHHRLHLQQGAQEDRGSVQPTPSQPYVGRWSATAR